MPKVPSTSDFAKPNLGQVANPPQIDPGPSRALMAANMAVGAAVTNIGQAFGELVGNIGEAQSATELPNAQNAFNTKADALRDHIYANADKSGEMWKTYTPGLAKIAEETMGGISDPRKQAQGKIWAAGQVRYRGRDGVTQYQNTAIKNFNEDFTGQIANFESGIAAGKFNDPVQLEGEIARLEAHIEGQDRMVITRQEADRLKAQLGQRTFWTVDNYLKNGGPDGKGADPAAREALWDWINNKAEREPVGAAKLGGPDVSGVAEDHPEGAVPVGNYKSWGDIPRDSSEDKDGVRTGSYKGDKPGSREFLGPRDGGHHAGMDIPAKIGEPVLAPGGGKVISVREGQGYGLMVDYEDEKGRIVRNGHMSSASVKVGDIVPPGGEIGKVGDSGNTRGWPHLHVEVFPDKTSYGRGNTMSSRAGAKLRMNPREYFGGMAAGQNVATAPKSGPQGSGPNFQPNVNQAIDAAATQVGVDPKMMRAFAQIESSGNPDARTGSYKGLFQLSEAEFKKYGGTGDIHDPVANANAAAAKLKDETARFEQRHGRAPTAADIYLVHQQGEAGAAAHLANPDGVAWENIREFYGSEAKAKKAISGNIPSNMRVNVSTLTSGEFVKIWSDKVASFGGEQSQNVAQNGAAPQRVSELRAGIMKLGGAPAVKAAEALVADNHAILAEAAATEPDTQLVAILGPDAIPQELKDVVPPEVLQSITVGEAMEMVQAQEGAPGIAVGPETLAELQGIPDETPVSDLRPEILDQLPPEAKAEGMTFGAVKELLGVSSAEAAEVSPTQVPEAPQASQGSTPEVQKFRGGKFKPGQVFEVKIGKGSFKIKSEWLNGYDERTLKKMWTDAKVSGADVRRQFVSVAKTDMFGIPDVNGKFKGGAIEDMRTGGAVSPDRGLTDARLAQLKKADEPLYNKYQFNLGVAANEYAVMSNAGNEKIESLRERVKMLLEDDKYSGDIDKASQKLLSEKINKLEEDRLKDPGKFGEESQLYKEALAGMNGKPNNAQDKHKLIDASIRSQLRIGIPEKQIRPLSADQARTVATKFKGLDERDDPLGTLRNISKEVMAEYGERYAGMIMKQAIEQAKLDKASETAFKDALMGMITGENFSENRYDRLQRQETQRVDKEIMMIGPEVPSAPAYNGPSVWEIIKRVPGMISDPYFNPTRYLNDFPLGEGKYADPAKPEDKDLDALLSNQMSANSYDAKYGPGEANRRIIKGR